MSTPHAKGRMRRRRKSVFIVAVGALVAGAPWPMKTASAAAIKAPTATTTTAFLLLRIGPLAGGVDMARPPWVGVNRGRCPQSPKSCGPASKNTSQWPLTRQGKRTWTGVAVAADLATISLNSLPRAVRAGGTIASGTSAVKRNNDSIISSGKRSK